MRGLCSGLLLLLFTAACQRLGAPARSGTAAVTREQTRPLSPDFALSTTAGAPRMLHQLRGSYVLLDFRAHNCAACRAENANLRKVYGQFHSRGLEVVSVFLDDNPAGSVAADSLEWPVVSAAQGLDGTIARAYGVQQVPLTVLLDPQGHELARDLRGRALGQKIAEFIPLD
ncbi:alkyl hydroperoxide reductase [Hymenobacter amundsenii]|uniref:Alkyl hydroperoxide reductase n=1 Tax=Hymenobacter amundsenii TaxID=2006685 RepID=A0A246FMS5_9BACT|nr:TlpA disulfide reductase family protein [Hymenobacter amundsenii]OWP64057.1 alkyl hydroperoxide reductase [Hymenobacter amundsenii]